MVRVWSAIIQNPKNYFPLGCHMFHCASSAAWHLESGLGPYKQHVGGRCTGLQPNTRPTYRCRQASQCACLPYQKPHRQPVCHNGQQPQCPKCPARPKRVALACSPSPSFINKLTVRHSWYHRPGQETHKKPNTFVCLSICLSVCKSVLLSSCLLVLYASVPSLPACWPVIFSVMTSQASVHKISNGLRYLPLFVVFTITY